MALAIEDARPTTREITLPSSIRGFDDRTFKVTCSAKGIEVREKGDRGVARRLSWREFMSWVVLHCPEVDA